MTTELFTKGYDSQNEDYCKVVELEGRTLVIMADGMGGLSLGAEAAECVCEAIAEYVSKHLDAENLWQETFKYADKKLRELTDDELRVVVGGSEVEFLFDDKSGDKEFRIYEGTVKKEFEPKF